MIKDIQELNFPKKNGIQYATLAQATVTMNDMGEKTIDTQVKIDGDIVPDFTYDWAVSFQGEKYIMPLRIPAGEKGNESIKSTMELTFQHWAVYQLKRFPFVTIQQIPAGTYLPDEEEASVQLNLKDFCNLFGQVLEYYYGDTIAIDLNPDWQYKTDATLITISHTTVWNVLIDAFYNQYGVRWEIQPAESNSNATDGGERYVIRVGYPSTEVDHIFQYGFNGGLLKIERQVQSEDIRNVLKGRGGDTNLPFRYFKDVDPNNPDFRADPDWVEELASIYFTRLMGATFRSYVQGWKAAHVTAKDAEGNLLYPGYTPVGESNAYAPWAYRKGFTDAAFQPVEFVADEIVTEPSAGDVQVAILPGYSPYVKAGSSLHKYGPLVGTLDNNDDIYPTIQGTGMDIAVDVEQVKSDDVSASADADATVSNIKGTVRTQDVTVHTESVISVEFPMFIVPSGQTANLNGGNITKRAFIFLPLFNNTVDLTDRTIVVETPTIEVTNAVTGEKHSASGIPSGTWRWTAKFKVKVEQDANIPASVTIGYEAPTITLSTLADKWAGTFDIWVKNIWGTTKQTGETDAQYADRVWTPILGDREGNTAKVVFTSGALVHEDYEFVIVKTPVYDTSKTYGEDTSHWRITLAKSDAELDSTGLYVPSTKKQGSAGDTFAFVGTEMTHTPYVTDAEKRLDDWKTDELNNKKDVKPTIVVSTDRIRINNGGKSDALVNQFRVGNSIRVADSRLITPSDGKAYETLYLQSITYTFREPSDDDAALNPDVDITLGEEYATSANPVSVMQGDISALQRQIGAISNIEQIVRAVGDKLYLRKDGISDISYSPTKFFSLLTSGDFRSGIAGGAGWGMYKDENGNWVIEADRLNIRQEMQVNELVINQSEGRGGMTIDTAAYIACNRVEDTDAGYVCYFDRKMGSVANLFHLDDVAYCSRWTPDNDTLKYYRRRVIAVGVDNITLSKSDVNGNGVPAAGDNIIHYGNYTDATRQYVKVRDVVGGGYESYIEGLDSVSAAGVEYFFVGMQSGESRWFVGNRDAVPYSGRGDGSFIEYINRKFTLNNVSLSVNTTIGDTTLEEYIKLVSPPVKQEDIEGFVNNIVDPKLDVIQGQLDGVIETWFADGVPTLTNYPANEWSTDKDKDKHLGDLYFDNNSGLGYRFSKDDAGTYYWNDKVDSAIADALSQAAKAQDTADQKRRVFVTTPYTPYEEGDLWTQGTNGGILRCKTTRLTGDYDAADWESADNYSTRIDNAMNAIAQYEYLKNALSQDTSIEGGLIMSTLISLGYNDAAGDRHTLAGMNGSYAQSLGGRTIASWWGGENVDRFDTDGKPIAIPPKGAATALVRMDGSAYFSRGNVNFKADGSGWLGGQDGINFTADGRLVLGNGVLIDVSGEKGLAEALSSLTAFSIGMSSLIVPCDDNGNELTWDNVTDATSVKVKVGLWTEHFLSARGKDSSGSSSGGTDLQTVWSSLSTNTDAFKDKKIDINHIPDIAISNVTGLTDSLNSKVDKEEGKGLSSNDYTDTDKNKLTGIETGAEVNKISSIKFNGTALSISSKSVSINAVTAITVPTGLSASALSSNGNVAISLSSGYTIPKESRLATIESALGDKVDKIEGKGLSTNDFTDAFKTKLTGIESGAEVNKIASVKLNGTALAISSKAVNVNAATSIAVPAAMSSSALSTDGKISLSLKSGYTIPAESRLTAIEKIAALFALDADGNVYVTGSRGFYSNSFISSRGKDSSGGTGGGGSSLEEVWASLTGNTDAYKDSKINLGHIPAIGMDKVTGLSSALLGKADRGTTLADYGIGDAYTADETDALLSGKSDTGHKHAAADITSGTLALDLIPTIPYAKTSGVQAALVSGTSIKTINGVSILGSGNIVTPNTTYSSKAAASGGTDLSLVTTGEKYTWNAKQAAISDLATIRSNATNGATAYGWGDHSKAGYLKSIAHLTINGTLYDGTSAVTINTPTYTLSSFGITASATELNYVKGVTSAIQTQLNAKASSSALANYLPLAGGTMSGNITFPNNRGLVCNASTTSNWIEPIIFLKGGVASGKTHEAGIGWHNTGGSKGTGAITLVPHAQDTDPWGRAVGLAITEDQLTFNGKEVSLNGHTHTFASLTSKPTTLAGYGITDALKVYGGTGAVDLNTLTTNGTYYISSGATNSPGAYREMLCMRNNDTAAQLAISYASSGDMKYRGGLVASSGNTWYDWRTVLDSANYNNYAPTKTGTGASGTWGITITGGSEYLIPHRNPTTGTGGTTAPLLWFTGQPAIGTTEGCAYKGSSSNYNLWSYPAGGTSETTTFANIQTLRLSWDKSKYWHDIFASPNGQYLWHRSVQNASAGNWHRIVEENASNGWDISITGNAATVTKLATARTIWGQSFDGSGNVSGHLILGITGDSIMSYGEAAGGMLLHDGKRTIVGSIGAHTTAATHIRSITGHISCGSSSANYTMLDSGNYSSFALPLTGGTLTGNLAVTGNSLSIGNSNLGNLLMMRPSNNYIWANATGGTLYLGTAAGGVTGSSTAGVGIVGKQVCIGGTTLRYSMLNVQSNISIVGSSNPLIDFRNSSNTTIGYVQAFDAGWMGLGPGSGKGIFVGKDGALTINSTPPTTPTGNSIDAPGAIHSTTGVYSEGYVSARGVDSSSDERLKTDIRPLENALQYVLGTKYRSFRWKEDGKPCIGVIAQEELGREHGYLVEKHRDYYSYNYAATTALIGAALQEEDRKVEALKKKITELENEVRRLRGINS